MRKLAWFLAFLPILSFFTYESVWHDVRSIIAYSVADPISEAKANQPVTIAQLRTKIREDSHAVPGQQFIHIGPMTDGRELFITTQVVNNSSDAYIEPAGPDRFIIHLGRELILRSIYLSDAMIICTHLPDACAQMPDYIDRVQSSHVLEEAPFLEEAFPELRKAAESVRADDAVYRASLLAGIQSTVLMVSLHEIGHAALRHLGSSKTDEINQEGEADGFAVSVAETGDQPPAGLAVALLLDVSEETKDGHASVGHPPSICRVLIASSKGLTWLDQNKEELLKSSGNAVHDHFMRDMLDHISSGNMAQKIDETAKQSCKPYIASFLAGYTKAGLLINQHTNIDSAVPGQH